MQYIYIHPSYFLCGINFYFNPTTTGGGLHELIKYRDSMYKGPQDEVYSDFILS